jgi:multiple sugar transport system ATP-binding protein
MSTLQLRRLSKTYSGRGPVVTDLDLDVDDGELFVLVGPSGCGKTTVLRMIAGLEDVSSGDVVMDGVVINDVDAGERDIAMAFQTYALYPHMTVAENIGFPLRLAHMRVASVNRRVREVANLLQLADVLDRHPKQLSGGQQQRSALGRALVREPRLLLMDEPMSNLDTKLRAETRSAIWRIQRRLGLTTVCVTHDQVEAMSMGDRIAVMCEGRIVQCGPPLELYEHPVDLFVGQFIGSPSMNVFEATVIGTPDAPALRVGRQSVALDDVALARLPVVRRLVGHKVAFGVRPEALHRDVAGSLVASVSFSERLGSDQLVHATIGAASVRPTERGTWTDHRARSPIIVAMGSAIDINVWEPLTLRVDTTQIHLFDLSTGAALR